MTVNTQGIGGEHYRYYIEYKQNQKYKDIENQQPQIILRNLRLSVFQENPFFYPGKFYCRRERVINLLVNFIFRFSYSDFSDYLNNSGDIIHGYPIHSYHSPVFIQLNNFTFPLQT